MIKKFIFLIMLTFYFTGCGFSPMYSDKSKTNFMITDAKIEGNSEINKVIESKIKNYFKNNNEKKYKIKIETSLNKSSAAKDATGKSTNLKLTTNLNLTYIVENIEEIDEKNRSFSESITLKINDNNYEQNTYEKIIIKNMSETLFNKMIFYLSTIK